MYLLSLFTSLTLKTSNEEDTGARQQHTKPRKYKAFSHIERKQLLVDMIVEAL